MTTTENIGHGITILLWCLGIALMVSRHLKVTAQREAALLRSMHAERIILQMCQARYADVVLCPCHAPDDAIEGAPVCLGCGGPKYISLTREVIRLKLVAEEAQQMSAVLIALAESVDQDPEARAAMDDTEAVPAAVNAVKYGRRLRGT